MSSEVRLEKIRKVFRDSHTGQDVVAVSEFSLTIRRGELLTLLGPSGCGKTTLLRMLAGFENPTGGDIYLDDKAITSLPPNKRNSAMVFQSYALFPHMNVLQNISYGLKFRNIGSSEKQDRLDQIIHIVGLKGLETRRPSELSGGQQQRVALARALVVQPGLLLFDEPLSNLDAKLRESMRYEIRRIQRSLNITAVYVTHDQVEAMSLSDRVVVMNKGRVEQVGSPREIYRYPSSRFVADFMGISNLIDCDLVAASGGRATLKTADFEIEVEERQNIRSKTGLCLMIRPEDIEVDPAGNIRGEIIETVFLGERFEVLIELPNRTLLTARLKAGAYQQDLNPGSKVSLRLLSERLTYAA